MAEEGCKLFVYGIDQNMANGDIQVSDDDDAGVLPCPCFPKILARTTFVLVSLPKAKNPG